MQALVLVRQWLAFVDALRAHADALALVFACGALALLLVRFLIVRRLAHTIDDDTRTFLVVARPRTLVAHSVAALVNPLNVWMTLLARRVLSADDAPRALVVDARDTETGARTALRAMLVAFRHQASAPPRSLRAVSVSLGVLALQQVAMQTSMLLITLALAGEIASSFVVIGVLVYASEIAMTLAVERVLTGPLSTTSVLLRFVTQPLAMLALPVIMLAALLTSDAVRNLASRLADVLAPAEVRAAERHTPHCVTVVVSRVVTREAPQSRAAHNR